VAVPNPIFFYEIGQMSKEYFWRDMSEFLEFPRSALPEEKPKAYVNGTSASKTFFNEKQTEAARKQADNVSFDICLEEYDKLRRMLLSISHTLHEWLTTYFVPAAAATLASSSSRSAFQQSSENVLTDKILIPNVTHFLELIDSYRKDPCNRLVRNDTDGMYYLMANLTEN